MGIRQNVKSGSVSSEEALRTAERFKDEAPELKGWLRRRISRGADAEEQSAREKSAEREKASASGKRKKK